MKFKSILKAAGAVVLGGAAALAGASVVKDCKKSKTSEDCKDAGSDDDGLRSVDDALNNKSSDD